MDCNGFEERLSEYLDGLLAAEEANLFRAHALSCRECRSLMDEVKAAIECCRRDAGVPPSDTLERSLTAIATESCGLRCDQFEELITDFLDGFVPATTYHRFEEHAERCDGCSNLLTSVVYAVAACHSVHTFEEVEVPHTLVEKLTAMMPVRERILARRIADSAARLAELLMPRMPRSRRWTFATAASLGLATFAFLLLGFSDDGTFAGVYRQAHVRASELYTHGTDLYSETDEVVARLERVGRGLGEIWDTLGGAPAAGPQTNQGDKPASNSNEQVRSAERN